MGRLVDLSHPIEPGMVTYPGLPGPVVSDFLGREASRGHYSEGTTFHIARIRMVANTGTYVDAPFHRFAHGKDIGSLPLESLADVEGVVAHVGIEQGLGHDALRDRHHVGVDVARLPVPPVRHPALGVARHHVTVAGDALAMEGRLHQPPLAQPRVTLAQEQSVAQDRAQHLEDGSLGRVAGPGRQHFLDEVGMAEEDQPTIHDPDRYHVTVVPHAGSEEAEHVAPELRQAADEQVALGPGRQHRPNLTPTRRAAR